MFVKSVFIFLLILCVNHQQVSAAEQHTSLRGLKSENNKCIDGDVDCLAKRIEIALNNPNTVIIDARQQSEVLANGFYRTTGSKIQWLNLPCDANSKPITVKTNCPVLYQAYSQILTNEKSPVVVYCGSGVRAGIVKAFLDEMGYDQVYNAGGFGKENFLLP